MPQNFPPAPFTGFRPAAFQFFRDLSENQTRDWMAAHKAVYEAEVLGPLRDLLAALNERFADEGLPLRGDPARSIFRLHRDIRFSRDKRPYKTHASFAITRSGGKMTPGVFYFHFDPEGSFMAAGFFRPEPPVLGELRAGLVSHPRKWQALETALRKAKLDLAGDDKLTRCPKGFDAPPPEVAEAVKLKSWIVRRDVPVKSLGSAKLVDGLTGFALGAAPLLDFGWSVLDKAGPMPERTRR